MTSRALDISSEDVCKCGDRRRDHAQGGIGRCNLNGLGHGVPGYTCEKFELSDRATIIYGSGNLPRDR